MTKAERIVSTALVEALTRTVWVDDHGNASNSDNGAAHAVILNATPAQNGRLVTVRVEPFNDEPAVEIQVTLSPPYEIRTQEVDPVRNIPDEEPEPAA